MRLVDRFNEIERELPGGWTEATLVLAVVDDAHRDRAAAMEGVRRLLRRLDGEGIRGALELVGATEAARAERRRRESLRDQWKRALDGVPADWSDLYAEVRFDSTDYVERGALLLAPLNPARFGEPSALRFRGAHHFGYGASPEMATRCFERCEEDGLTGEVEILHVLSDTNPVGTQGPVWLVDGRVV